LQTWLARKNVRATGPRSPAGMPDGQLDLSFKLELL
jgi:hypothetical protein